MRPYATTVNQDNHHQPGHGIINVICLSETSLMPCPYATTGSGFFINSSLVGWVEVRNPTYSR
ncbi:hypothetical protein [Microseira wollei]|uniref:hypothetical protein n=1 Tax=Microseira wollei TaxID=467598 RepID=UPI001CFF1D27|nr:hypothetical protein [Microseira wollei]